MLHPQMNYFVCKECTPAWKIEHQTVDFYSLVFILSGNAHYIIDGIKYEPIAGNVVFVKYGSARTAWTERMRCVALDFTLSEGENIKFAPVTVRTDFDEFSQLFQEIKFEWLQKRDGYQLKCQALFSLILHKLLYTDDLLKKNRHVEVIKRYILEHYCENLTIQLLADHVNLNPVYCGALFKRKEGRSIREFINLIRINKAVDLLKTGEYNVGEVAERVGFNDIYFFSNTFRKIMGTPPKYFKPS